MLLLLLPPPPPPLLLAGGRGGRRSSESAKLNGREQLLIQVLVYEALSSLPCHHVTP